MSNSCKVSVPLLALFIALCPQAPDPDGPLAIAFESTMLAGVVEVRASAIDENGVANSTKLEVSLAGTSSHVAVQ